MDTKKGKHASLMRSSRNEGNSKDTDSLPNTSLLINDVNTEQTKKLDRILGFDDSDAPHMHLVEKW